MIVGKVLKRSFKWVVLEVCSFIHLEVIIYSSQFSKMKISLRLLLDCSNLFCNIYHLYIKINIKTIWPMERSWKDLQLRGCKGQSLHSFGSNELSKMPVQISPINTRIYGHWEKCFFFKHPNLVSDNESKQHKMELISFHSPYCMPLYRVFKLSYVIFFHPVSGETPCRTC